jgi:phosphoribosylformimino-5-aminoimidazole carboxamide ribotide isomerase
VIGTEAIRNPNLIKEACRAYPGYVVIGIDARNGKVAVEGWTEDTQIEAVDLAKQLEDAGIAAINFTDIHRDGMQTGPNIEQTRSLAKAVSVPVVASGGVSTMDDVINLLPLESDGVEGVIVGKALYSGTLNLEKAIHYLSHQNGEV